MNTSHPYYYPLFQHMAQTHNPMAVSAAIHVQPRETLIGGTWPENESTETDYVPRAELEKVVKERDELRAAALSLYRQTCIHHTDAERKAAGCPVCQQKERDELRELLSFLNGTVLEEVRANGCCQCNVEAGDNPCGYCATVNSTPAITEALTRAKEL